ncbi:ClpP/crotonase-like domain-containing protein [Endogone sp. FLAS-F59071]|nr:ClpP/crotonase-like domain-containing protein [Endogone sp. FLAS-F59071]|eukprot:RUS17350.1 ClpP/crotonase-like domain-containing protein [Endogone sp. FLAS-F59071]
MSTFAPVSFPANKPLVTLTRSGPVFLLTLHNDDNRFTTTSVGAIFMALDVVERAYVDEGMPEMALVTTGKGKFYSNGLDLEHALSTPRFMEDYYLKMLSRLCTFPIPTVAAINGHAFAGGCVFAMAHDYRVMRSDRGFICMNEIDFGAPIPPGMTALLRTKMQPHTFRDVALLGRRFGGGEALEHHIVDEIVKGTEEEVLRQATMMAIKVSVKAKSGASAYQMIKAEMYGEVVNYLAKPFDPSGKSSGKSAKL